MLFPKRNICILFIGGSSLLCVMLSLITEPIGCAGGGAQKKALASSRLLPC